MKISIRTPDGKSKTRECSGQKELKIMLARGWKECKEAPKKAKKSKGDK